ncbi:MAG TPA: flagellar motor protein MotA [Persephonella sp.]|uniref:Biopolymer transport protein ExbB n=1 Tax=Persephonella marina (strain DSM 14350 / EX-H1) TaxID=123214 RepID=C0QU45_PERMH|nr:MULTISPECIES: MotA/TolQ/ExbB proton channel family protein [Persephonella]ACO02964.1 biopolymer transport protein ExbB [Persephonella marina EX-H1]HCB70173.1 flagellar motor protein MotA [Persephonella sp.]
MNITETILKIALIGGDPVLYILILMSVITIAVVIERYLSIKKIQENMLDYEPLELKLALEKRLGILATFGNNAPFIGLFGTVLGIIKAFHDLGTSTEFGVRVVMQGISEALVATAMGLFVAIPAVIAYNYFVRKVKTILLTYEQKKNLPLELEE